MFTLSVIVKGRENPVTLFFNTRAPADEVTRDSFFATVEDDYGAGVTLDPALIVGLVVNDAMKAIKAQGKMALLQAREQADLQREAQRDIRIAGFGGVASRSGIIG